MKPSILICGQTGTGKSSIVNFRLREPVAKVGNDAESVRNGFPPPKYENDTVIFYDTDGYEIGSTDDYKNKLMNFLEKKTGTKGVHLVWFTINAAHRVTPFDKEIVSLISEDFHVCILLTKIDECDEDGLKKFFDEVSGCIPETPIFKVSTIQGEIQKYADWDDLVEFTIWALNEVTREREIIQKLTKLTNKARAVIEDSSISSGLSALLPPLLDSAVLLIPLSNMVVKILKVYDLNLSDNVVSHVIKSVLPQIIGKTAIRSGLKLIPVVGWIAGAAAGGAGNVLIARSLGEATIDLCNEYLYEELSNSKNKRNFEDIFTSGDFYHKVKEHMDQVNNIG